MNLSARAKAIIASLLSTILSSVAWITEREAVLALSPLIVAGFSLVLGGGILLGIARYQGTLSHLANVRGEWRAFLLLLFTRGFAGQLLLVYSLALTTASKVMFLTKIEPYLIVFWFWLLKKERIGTRHLALLFVHISGAILLSTGGTFSLSLDQRGDLLLLGGMAANSLSYIPAQRLAKSVGASATSGLTAIISGTVLLPLALVIDGMPDFSLEGVAAGWGYLLVTVVIFYVFSTLFWYYSLVGIPAWLSSALRCVGPLVAAPIAYLFFDETLSFLQICGAMIVLITSVQMVRLRGTEAKK